MLLLGASPPERNIEQHDIFFSIGENLSSLVPGIRDFWPEAKNKLHIDAWREVTRVDSFSVRIVSNDKEKGSVPSQRLFFLNLGGYKKDEFEEFHYKMLVTAPDKAGAVNKAKQTAFYKHTGFPEASSHIDDKFGVDVDDIYEIADILPADIKNKYSIEITPSPDASEDQVHLGYFQLHKL
jgi:hypothetical protein